MAAKYTPIQVDTHFNEILLELESGSSLRKILKEKHISSRTFNEWLFNNIERQNQYAHAREVQADKLFDEILDIADDSSRDTKFDKDGNPYIDNEFVQRSRLRIDARKWQLSKMLPKKYGDSVKLTGDADNPIQSKLTIEVLPASGRIASSESDIDD